MGTKQERLQKEGVARAVMAVGTFSELARRLGTSRQAVQKWARVPEARVEQVARITGVPKHILRPDLYEK
jgi:DNA-binding transcriptional regulator YdaS (Cro superfamily)